jgi:recombination protein RecR
MAADYPPSFQKLIEALRQLPSIGPRSAERLALFLVADGGTISRHLAQALTDAQTQIHACPQCGFFSESATRCAICSDPQRDATLWCVVEQASEILKLERSGGFRGLYHALGGRLSPLDNVGPEQLTIAALLERVRNHPPREIILALGADVEGETTALYLAPLLKTEGVKVTRLATGLPAGGGLEYVDMVTLGYALSGRHEI